MDPITIAALIGGGVSLIGNLVSQAKAKRESARQAEKAQAALDAQMQGAERDYIREYNTDALDRSDVAQVKRVAGQQAEKAAEMDAARGVVAGATPEAQAAKAAARGANYADMLSRIGAQGQRAKDIALARYDANRARNAYQASALATSLAQSHAISADNAARGAGSSATTIANTLINAEMGGGLRSGGTQPLPQVQPQTIAPTFNNVQPSLFLGGEYKQDPTKRK